MSADDPEDFDDAENASHTVSSVVRKDNGDIHIAITINNNNSNDGGATITGDEIGDEFGVDPSSGLSSDRPGRAGPPRPAAGSAPTLDAAILGPFVRGGVDDAFAAAPVYTKGRAPFEGGSRPRARISLGGLVAHGRAALFTPAVIHAAEGICQGLCVVEIGAGNAPAEVTLVPDATVDAPWATATHALRAGITGGHYRLAVSNAAPSGKPGKGKPAPPEFTVTLTPVDAPSGGFLTVFPAGPEPATAFLPDSAARGACVPVPPAGGTLSVPRPAGAPDGGFFFVVTSTRPDALSPPLLEVRSNVGFLGESGARGSP